MMKDYYATKMAKTVMLETAEHDARYTFYTNPVKQSNVSDKIVGYQCIIKYTKNLITGSSVVMSYVSKQEGNKTYLELLAKGCVKVDKPSFA